MIVSPLLITISINLSIIFILLSSIFLFSSAYIKNKNPLIFWTSNTLGVENLNNENSTVRLSNTGPFVINTLKLSAFLSIFSLILSLYSNFNVSNIIFSFWINNTASNVSLNFVYDQYFTIFLSVALVVTWSIMEFSYYYMYEDPNNPTFFRLLVIFLLNMLVLTCSNSLFLLFLGWEGVGFLSFLLISWWTTRNDASSSALEAVIYNRIGDIGLILFMSISILSLNSWNINEILFLESNPDLLNFLLFGLMLAAAGKSAQFGLHPWLPAAMEGPTPVSALLHSSTMVVAGVFLLVRTSSLFTENPTMQSAVLLLGGVTAIFAASSAINQHDIKKIIAYSTTSQLGLMVTAIGIGSPVLAFFHICTHAFFKAMLFLCSGSIIHSLNDEQDLRKMGGLSSLLPITSACLTLGSLALMGIPFLAGFYSKDIILELTGASTISFLGISLSIIATMLTAVYSLRIVLFCFVLNPSINSLPPISEENNNLTNSLLRLATGTIIAGWLFSNFVFENPSPLIPTLIKSLPLIVTLSGISLSVVFLGLLVSNKTNNAVYSTLTSQWFFTEITHTIYTLTSFFTSLILSSRILDRGWQENVGPQGISSVATNVSKNNQLLQNGLIKSYLTSSMLLLTVTILSFNIFLS